jgi:small subunit ribosomal protein S6
MNRYETVFILTPVLSEDQAKEAVGKFKKVIKDTGAKILHEEHWGLKKMAYPIMKKTTGFYQLFEFTGEPNIMKDIETAYKRDERILRYLTVKLDKHAVAYAEKKRGTAKKEKAAAAEK